MNTSAPKHSRLVPCSDRSPELKSVSRHREWCLFVLGIFAIKFVLLIVDPLPKYYLGDSFSYIYTATSGWIPPDRSYFYGYVIRWLALWTGSLTPLLIVQVCLGGIVAIVAAWICWTIFELPSWASIFLLTCTGYPSQQALNRRRIDRKPGMRAPVCKQQGEVPPVRGARGIQPLLPRRSWYCFVRHRPSVLKRAVVQAFHSGPN